MRTLSQRNRPVVDLRSPAARQAQHEPVWFRFLVIAAALLEPVPAAAAPAPLPLRAQLEAFQALDARVQSIGWRLIRSNAAYCRTVSPRIGLTVFDAAGFADPAAVRAALGLPGDIAVEAVAADSPAARAGLHFGQPLRAVAGQAVESLPAAGPNDYARLVALHDRIDAALVASGKVAVTVGRGTDGQITGEPVCITRFELLSSGSKAAADGKRVVIGRKLVEAFPEEELLAAALAHELAHNLLGHRARLDASGRSWSKVRATEREADRLSVWLLANAGYDPMAAVRFFERWGPKFDLGILATPDHDGWKARVKLVAAEIEMVEAARGSDRKADWQGIFAAPQPQTSAKTSTK